MIHCRVIDYLGSFVAGVCTHGSRACTALGRPTRHLDLRVRAGEVLRIGVCTPNTTRTTCARPHIGDGQVDMPVATHPARPRA